MGSVSIGDVSEEAFVLLACERRPPAEEELEPGPEVFRADMFCLTTCRV